jgi:hypothetical protein
VLTADFGAAVSVGAMVLVAAAATDQRRGSVVCLVGGADPDLAEGDAQYLRRSTFFARLGSTGAAILAGAVWDFGGAGPAHLVGAAWGVC